MTSSRIRTFHDVAAMYSCVCLCTRAATPFQRLALRLAMEIGLPGTLRMRKYSKSWSAWSSPSSLLLTKPFAGRDPGPLALRPTLLGTKRPLIETTDPAFRPDRCTEFTALVAHIMDQGRITLCLHPQPQQCSLTKLSATIAL